MKIKAPSHAKYSYRKEKSELMFVLEKLKFKSSQ